MKISLTKRQKELLNIIYKYIKSTGFPPTFEEMKELLNVSSNQSVIDLLEKLEKKKIIQRKEGAARSIAILPVGYEILGKPRMAPFLGATAAGAYAEAIEIAGQWQQLSKDVAQLQENVFFLKVYGDSMINAGIDNGDAVLVQTKKEFVSGDIVLAETPDGTTVKRFMSEDKPPYVYLKPENPKYENILFTDEVELKGKIISVVKNGEFKQVK